MVPCAALPAQPLPSAAPPLQTFFANERTFLSWLHMAITIGSISTALLGFTSGSKKEAAEVGGLARAGQRAGWAADKGGGALLASGSKEQAAQVGGRAGCGLQGSAAALGTARPATNTSALLLFHDTSSVVCLLSCP